MTSRPGAAHTSADVARRRGRNRAATRGFPRPKRALQASTTRLSGIYDEVLPDASEGTDERAMVRPGQPITMLGVETDPNESPNTCRRKEQPLSWFSRCDGCRSSVSAACPLAPCERQLLSEDRRRMREWSFIRSVRYIRKHFIVDALAAPFRRRAPTYHEARLHNLTPRDASSGTRSSSATPAAQPSGSRRRHPPGREGNRGPHPRRRCTRSSCRAASSQSRWQAPRR
jgi:hypothetical protein